MPTGRCAGCGYVNSDRRAKLHVVGCSDFLELFENDPDKALDPVTEYQRYKSEELTSDARAQRRDLRLTERFSELSALQDLQARRWTTPKDILED